MSLMASNLMVDVDNSDGTKQYNALVKIVSHSMTRPQDLYPFLERYFFFFFSLSPSSLNAHSLQGVQSLSVSNSP